MQGFAQRGVHCAEDGLIKTLEDEGNAQDYCCACPGSRYRTGIHACTM